MPTHNSETPNSDTSLGATSSTSQNSDVSQIVTPFWPHENVTIMSWHSSPYVVSLQGIRF